MYVVGLHRRRRDRRRPQRCGPHVDQCDAGPFPADARAYAGNPFAALVDVEVDTPSVPTPPGETGPPPAVEHEQVIKGGSGLFRSTSLSPVQSFVSTSIDMRVEAPMLSVFWLLQSSRSLAHRANLPRCRPGRPGQKGTSSTTYSTRAEGPSSTRISETSPVPAATS